jgi:threonine dehydrogenase-like Zn-dependent dehydrogenase
MQWKLNTEKLTDWMVEKMLKKGDKVVMHTCGEAEYYNGKIWTVSSNPWNLCGSEVVMLDGFSGGFATEYLQKVNV